MTCCVHPKKRWTLHRRSDEQRVLLYASGRWHHFLTMCRGLVAKSRHVRVSLGVQDVSLKTPGARRTWLKGAGLAAAALSPAAAVAASSARSTKQQPASKEIVWRCQTAWSLDDDFAAYLQGFARSIAEMTDGQLRVEILPAGSVVPSSELAEAVSDGRLDACQRLPSSQADRLPALGLWGTGPAFGMDGATLMSWHYEGGGHVLMAELYESAGLAVHSILYGTMQNQAFGWFKRPLARVDDLVDLRIRAGGMGAQIYREMGATVLPLPAEEILPALAKGEIDAVEFSSISSDRALGLPDVLKVCMLQSFHQCSEQIELLINRERYEALTPSLRTKVNLATEAVSAEMARRRVNDNSMHYIEMRELKGVRFYKTPESMLRAQLAGWDRVAARHSHTDPMFARVLDSMRRYAQRCVGWQNDTRVDQRMAYNHYFAQRVPKAT